jgi:serine/threonine-protein kinase
MEHTYLRGHVIAERYEIIEALEDRGYCTLYKGKDWTTGTAVLLKNTRSISSEARVHFEYVISHPVEHPNLARRLYGQWFGGFGSREGNGSWEVFEWIDGPTLETWLANQDTLPDPREAVARMIEVCHAVEYMHRSQPSLLHKHITPAAIKLWKDGEGRERAIVRDYGTTHVDQPLRMRSDAALNANRRAAPEQYGPGDIVNEQTDVYGIGATLYHMLTGRQPPRGNDRRQHGIVVERADVINPRVSRKLADVTQRAMAVRPEDRFASVADLRIALAGTIRSQSSGTSSGGSDGMELFVGLLALAAIAAVIVLFTNINDSPTVPQATPAGVGGGGQPTAVLFTPVPPTATPDIAATLTAADTLLVPLAGPLTGELPVTDIRPAVELIAGPLTDFIIEATFVNPDAPVWDYGFAFRHSDTSHFRLSIASDGTWNLMHRSETPSNPTGAGDTLPITGLAPLALGAGQTNHLRLLAVGPYGVITINGQPVAQVDLSIKTEPGNVFVAAGLRGARNEVAVTYRDLVVRASQ